MVLAGPTVSEVLDVFIYPDVPLFWGEMSRTRQQFLCILLYVTVCFSRVERRVGLFFYVSVLSWKTLIRRPRIIGYRVSLCHQTVGL